MLSDQRIDELKAALDAAKRRLVKLDTENDALRGAIYNIHHAYYALDAFLHSPVTVVQIWRGDTLVFEVMLVPGQRASWPFGLDREGTRVERVPYRWEGEGTLRRLVPTLV